MRYFDRSPVRREPLQTAAYREHSSIHRARSLGLLVGPGRGAQSVCTVAFVPVCPHVCINGHDLTDPANLYDYGTVRKPRRQCKACALARAEESRRKRREARVAR